MGRLRAVVCAGSGMGILRLHAVPARLPSRSQDVSEPRVGARPERGGEARARRGRTAHGILVYDRGEPIGWCQYGPAQELPLPGAERLDRRIPPLGDGVQWRVTCFVTVVTRRRRGVAGVALRGAIKAIRSRGGGLVEAYPTLTPHDSNWAHAGTVSLFEGEGFCVVGWPSEKYVVMQLAV